MAANHSQSGDASRQIVDHVGGYSLRECIGPRPWLNWQAGVMVAERRNYRGHGMVRTFTESVSLFRLLGYGVTRDEALEMARKRE